MVAVNMDERQNSNDPLLLASAPPMCVLTSSSKADDMTGLPTHSVAVPRGLLVQNSHRSRCRTLTPMVLVVLGTMLMACSVCIVSWQTLHMQDLQSQVDNLTAITSKLRQDFQKISNKIETVELLSAFENSMKENTQNEPEEEDDMDEDEEEDNLAPSYPDAEDDQHFVVEAKEAHSPDADHRDSPLEPLLPAGSRGKRSIAQAPRAMLEGPSVNANLQPRLRLYDTLANPGDTTTTARPWFTEPERRQPHHKAPMFAERPPLGYVTHPVTPGTHPPTTPMTSRRSRVMAGARQRAQHPSERLERMHGGQHPQGQDVQHVEQDDDEGQPQDYAENLYSRESIDSAVEVERTWRPLNAVVEGPAIAAHFVGDSSRHRHSAHYDANGRLKHPHGHYSDWRASPWVRDLGLDRHFGLGEAGDIVRVDTPGLYLVYAQVNYANEKDENGYWVYRNGEKELLCVTTGGGGGSGVPRANTCFTAGVLQLNAGDRVSLRDLAGERYRVLDHPGRSFVGLINLQTCRLKKEQPARVTT